MTLGDPRAQTFDTINMTSYKMRDLPMTRAPLVDGFAEMSYEERDKVSRSPRTRSCRTLAETASVGNCGGPTRSVFRVGRAAAYGAFFCFR